MSARSAPVARLASSSSRGERVRPSSASPSAARLKPPSAKPTRAVPGGSVRCAGSRVVAGAAVAELSEEAAWKKRKEESKGAGAAAPTGDEWKWTLNWSEVTPDIVIGSCPRSPDDVGTLVSEGSVSAILSLQSDECVSSLGIDVPALKNRCVDENVLHARLGMRDFDRDDATAMLPDAVRTLAALVGSGRRVYVHCTAGINRAPLTVVGYLIFVKGMTADEAIGMVKKARPVANPYMDSLWGAKARMLHGRTDELNALSRQLYEARMSRKDKNDNSNDWFDAEDQVIQRLFARRLVTDVEALNAIAATTQKHGGFVRGQTEEETRLTSELAATKKAMLEATTTAAAELARVQTEAAATLAAAKKEAADALSAANKAAASALAEEKSRAAAELANTQKEAADDAIAAAAALDAANAAAQAALAAAAEQAAAELDAAAAAAQAQQEIAASQIQSALDAADVQAQASAARQAVLEKEVRRLADSAASAARFDAEAQARKSELEMAAVDMVKASATEVLRMREQMEALRRDVADLKSELAEKHTALVLAEGKVPLVQAAANVAAVAADAKKTTAAVAVPQPAAAAASNGNGNGNGSKPVAAAPAKK